MKAFNQLNVIMKAMLKKLINIYWVSYFFLVYFKMGIIIFLEETGIITMLRKLR